MDTNTPLDPDAYRQKNVTSGQTLFSFRVDKSASKVTIVETTAIRPYGEYHFEVPALYGRGANRIKLRSLNPTTTDPFGYGGRAYFTSKAIALSAWRTYIKITEKRLEEERLQFEALQEEES